MTKYVKKKKKKQQNKIKSLYRAERILRDIILEAQNKCIPLTKKDVRKREDLKNQSQSGSVAG